MNSTSTARNVSQIFCWTSYLALWELQEKQDLLEIAWFETSCFDIEKKAARTEKMHAVFVHW